MANEIDLINRIRDIQQPDSIPLWPLAPGWWFLTLLLLVGAVFFLVFWYRRRALRRTALKELRRLKQSYLSDSNSTALIMGLSILLRRVALTRDTRQQVAGLTGKRWLKYLDQRGDTPDFSSGPGRQLCTVPYNSKPAEDEEALLRLVQRWIVINT